MTRDNAILTVNGVFQTKFILCLEICINKVHHRSRRFCKSSIFCVMKFSAGCALHRRYAQHTSIFLLKFPIATSECNMQ